MGMSKRLLLILNPISGKQVGKRYLPDVLEAFCRADYSPTVFVTTSRGNAKEIACAYGGEADLVVCLGGDGTFNEVVSGMLNGGHTAPLGYIPCGSTNDFASSIGLKRNIPEATAAILNGTPHSYDVGLFGDRHFSYVASFGIFSRASYSASQKMKNKLGHMAYLLEGAKELGHIRSWHVKIEMDGQTVEEDCIFGAISNATSVGGVLTLDPERVDMSDGLLELLLVKMPHGIGQWRKCIRALRKKQYDSEFITFLNGGDFSITASAGMDWSLDGEQGSGSESIRIRNLHHAITLIH